MTRFLNISEGLIKQKTKKIIFTTNFSDFHSIDKALIRPGRCFNFLKFRDLHWDEVGPVCDAYNLSLPNEKKDYSLAELFNQKHTPVSVEKKFGFKT